MFFWKESVRTNKVDLDQVNPRVVFVSRLVLRLELKDLVAYRDKSCIIYKFNCFWERSYIGQTSRLGIYKTRVNEDIPKCVLNFIKQKNSHKTKVFINATKRSSIAEHLINNIDCANNYDLSIFKVINSYTNSVDLVRLKKYL